MSSLSGELAALAPTIAEIESLKKDRNAVILAHNYMTPDIYHTVADLTGDSLALARMAVEATADVIVMAGVHFMAETAKMLNPQKTVLIPDLRAVVPSPKESPEQTFAVQRTASRGPGGDLRKHFS